MSPAIRPLQGLLDLVFPRFCAGCRAAGAEICPGCSAEFQQLSRIPPPTVARVAANGGEFPCMYALGSYAGKARHIILSYKDGQRPALARSLGTLLASGVRLTLPSHGSGPDGSVVLVPAPSRGRAARRRGGSHMMRLARRAAAELARAGLGRRILVSDCLRMAPGVQDSAGLGAQQRLRNLWGRVRVRTEVLPEKAQVAALVLVDDIVTTGATLASCVHALVQAGHSPYAALSLTAVPPAEQYVRGIRL